MGKMKQLFVDKYEDAISLNEFNKEMHKQMTVMNNKLTAIKQILEDANEK